jgi:hypothetical protein
VAARRSFYKLPTRENVENLPEGYMENMLATYSESWIRRYLNGDAGIIEVGQPVMDGFYMSGNRAGHPWHLSDDKLEFNPAWPVIRAWDFGVAYMSVVWMQFIPHPYPRVVVLYEHTGMNTNAYAFGKTIKPISQNMFPGAVFIDVGDPTGRNRSISDGKSAFVTLREKHGINVMPAPTNDVNLRINKMAEYFSRNAKPGVPYVTISRSLGTEKLRDALEAGWSYKREEGGFISPTATPIKNQYSHCADALGYGFYYIDDYGDSIDPVSVQTARADYFSERGQDRIIQVSNPGGWMGM